MVAARRNLAELPGIEGDIRPIDAGDRRLDDDGGRGGRNWSAPPSTRPRMYSASAVMSKAPCSVPTLM
jgi:hypothetical protein